MKAIVSLFYRGIFFAIQFFSLSLIGLGILGLFYTLGDLTGWVPDLRMIGTVTGASLCIGFFYGVLKNSRGQDFIIRKKGGENENFINVS